MTETRRRAFRGISTRLAREYLCRLGGEVGTTGGVSGPRWSATITEETVEVGPSLELTEVQITFEGSAEDLDELIPSFARKAMRAGG